MLEGPAAYWLLVTGLPELQQMADLGRVVEVFIGLSHQPYFFVGVADAG